MMAVALLQDGVRGAPQRPQIRGRLRLRCCLSAALWAALCCGIPADDGDAYAWPRDAVAKKRTKPLASAAKRAARYVACDVCAVRVMHTLLPDPQAADVDMSVLEQSIEAADLAEVFGDVQHFCAEGDVVAALDAAGLQLEPRPDGTAVLASRRGDDATAAQSDGGAEDEQRFRWKDAAVAEACTSVFRRDGDKVADIVKDEYASCRENICDESVVATLSATVGRACNATRACRAQRVEEALTERTAERDRRRAERDADFRPRLQDLWNDEEKPFHDAQVDYYRVLGVDEYCSSNESFAAYDQLIHHVDVVVEMAKLGMQTVSVEKSLNTLRELNEAKRVLSSQTLRRKYDRDRDRLSLTGKLKVDRTSLDGAAALELLRAGKAPPALTGKQEL